MTNKGIGGHHSHRMGKDEWLTPPDIVNAVGPFDLDPCAPVCRPWDTAKAHYTVVDDGLRQPWRGRVFCNPPYGSQTGKWLAKCATHGNATALIFARTETRDWVKHVWGRADSILFIFGRLHFYHIDGTRSKTNSGAPSALISYDSVNSDALSGCGISGRLVRLR
jgi:hypothetical protein